MHPAEQELMAFIPVLFLLATPLFLQRATTINYDMPLALGWILFATAAAYHWRLIALCLGVWSKSLLGFFPMVFDIFRLRKKDLTGKTLVLYIGLLLIPLVWHLGAWLFYWSTFVQQHIIDHMIRRVTHPIELHFGGKLFYLHELWNQHGILLAVLGVGYALLGYEILRDLAAKRIPRYSLMVLTAPLIFIGFLTYSSTKIT